MGILTGTFGKQIIAFEGLDACGKDTQIEKLFEYFDKNGIKYYYAKQLETELGHFIREKYLTAGSNKPPMSLIMLFATERYEYCVEMKKKIKEGCVIVMNRFLLSAYAYGAYKALSIDPGVFNAMYDRIDKINADVRTLFWPGLTIYMDIKPEDAMNRIKSRNGDAEIYDDLKKLANIHEAFEIVILDKYGMSTNLPKLSKLVRIDAMKSIDDIHEDIVSSVEKYLKEIKEVSNENSSTGDTCINSTNISTCK